MPLDINYIRSNHQIVRKSQIKRFKDPNIVDQILDLDIKWKTLIGQIDLLNKSRNLKQKKLSQFYKSHNENSIEAIDLNTEIKFIQDDINICQMDRSNLEKHIDKLVRSIGNILAPDVPISKDEVRDMCVYSTWGSLDGLDNQSKPLNHHVLLEKIGGFDSDRGVKVAGHKGYFLKGPGVRLNQALINYSLDFLESKGYDLLQPPYFIKKSIMEGVVQLEDFEESLYQLGASADTNMIMTRDDPLCMIATSEQPICGYHANEWLGDKDLPKKYGGISTCFRKESGAHGKDTWGIFRVHQFDKIEQFAITTDCLEQSNLMQKQMIEVAEEFYQSLGIPHRVVNIVSGDLNNAAIRKYDLEGWFPGYNTYRELVSCSNCTDYQSRPMGIKCGEKRYVHMLNGTLCACTRVICCLLELGQTELGIQLPEVLGKYMGGRTFIPWTKS